MKRSDSLQKEQDKIRKFYDTVYYTNSSSPSVSSHLTRLANRLPCDEGTEVLDVGCGTGAWLNELHRRGAKTAGIDVSSTAINICRQSIPDGDYLVGPAETLPFSDNRFDIVTCLGALEHFIDPQKALHEMVRVAKDKAIFIILVPNAGFLTRRLGLYKGTEQKDVREEVLSLHEWNNLFQSVGLTVEQRWKDLHVLSLDWIFSRGYASAPIRAFQAIALTVWPLSWQYQVYHRCRQCTAEK